MANTVSRSTQISETIDAISIACTETAQDAATSLRTAQELTGLSDELRQVAARFTA